MFKEGISPYLLFLIIGLLILTLVLVVQYAPLDSLDSTENIAIPHFCLWENHVACNLLVMVHDLSNKVYYMSRVLVSGYGFKDLVFHL